MSISIDGFHITYNARHLKPEDVAKTFIFSLDYEEIIQDNHTVLLGARGCGKTTLMKMLTLPALYAWQNKNAEHIRNTIGYFSVYISTDIYWNAQKDAYNKQLKNFPTYAEYVSKVAVTTNVLYALCETFESIIKYKLNELNRDNEIELSKELIKLWLLTPSIPNLAMVKEALIKRTDLLNRHIQKTVFNSKNDEEVKEVDDYFHLDYDTSCLSAVSIFERIFNFKNDTRWALCFDELELAPDWLQERLFDSLRSRNQKFLYKLSASPIVSVSKNILATPGNDLRLIKMWPHDGNNEYINFSETLVKSILSAKFSRDVDPEILFGTNPILKKEQNNYKEEGDIWIQIKQLAKDDNDLRLLLEKHQINPDNPIATKENARKLDTVLRKVKPIVYFRNYYSYWDDKSQRRMTRSRKAHTLFYGKEVLFKICDGNPRWLIGIVNNMLQKGLKDDKIEKISEPIQASVLENIADQFFNVIKTIPDAIIAKRKGFITLYGILEEIGEHFFKEIVLDKFQRDPHSTFLIDRDIPEEYIHVLEKAVYQGAIILVDPSENAFDFEMRGKSFRLSYLFSPKFKIPIRKYATIPLSKCISGKETVLRTGQTKIEF